MKVLSRVIVCSISLLLINIVFAQPVLQKRNKMLLSFLNCQSTNQVFVRNRLQLGNKVKTSKEKQLFLIQNKSDHNLLLDYPEGHTGASAGLTQMLTPLQWQGYLYVKEKKKPISWACYNEKHKQISCQTNLFVCEIPYDIKTFQRSNSLVHQRLLMYLKKQGQSWWISDPKDRLLDVFINGYPVSTK